MAAPKNEWDLKPARLDNVPVWLGIAGPSSSGKTYSALLVATGMQEIKGGDIAVIDTENRRATHYSKQFKFMHLEFKPPFSQERYLDAARHVAGKGCKIIVVDSMSHEHEGVGGYLLTQKDLLDQAVKRAMQRKGENRKEWQLRDALKFSAWIEPAQARTFMVQNLLQIDASFIFCFRAKEKIKLEKDPKTRRTEVRSLGYMPIAGDELVYNCAALAILPPRSKGMPDWDSKGCKVNTGMEQFFPDGKALDRDTGRWLQQWATGKDVEVKWAGPARSGDDSRPSRGRQGPPTGDDDAPWPDEEMSGGPAGPEPPPVGEPRNDERGAPVAQQQRPADPPKAQAPATQAGTPPAQPPAEQAQQQSGEPPAQKPADQPAEQKAPASRELPGEFSGARAMLKFAQEFLVKATPAEAEAFDKAYRERYFEKTKEALPDAFNEMLDLLSSAKRGAMQQQTSLL